MDQQQAQNPFLTGNFAPVPAETTGTELPVRGRIPEELCGRLVRIGPNPIGAPDPARFHWFLGTGMVHGLRLRDGRAEWYRSRYVRSAEAARALGRDPLPGPGAGRRDGTVNTHLTTAGGKLFALVEAGSLPVELDDNLDSVARSDFGGTLEAGFTAHPKYEPATGLQHALTYEPFQPVRYVTIDPAGRATTVARLDMPHGPMIHDTAFTASSIVVLDLPATFQPMRARSGLPWIWDDQRPARVGLLPRDGDLSRLAWFEAPRCFVFHFLNAYDEGARTIVDLVRHPRMFATDESGSNEGPPALARWTLDRATGTLDETILDDRSCEFPRINGNVAGRRHRFGYTTIEGNPGVGGRGPGQAAQHDFERGRVVLHDYGPSRVTLEPVFVPRQHATAEDDGWIMSYVYDGERDGSDVVILDARDFSGDPVATIRLPARVPFGFHGGWIADLSAVPPTS